MSQLKFSVRLFDTTSLAADGSNIPRRSCEEYLQSPNYAESVRNKTAIGGLTHKDRKLRPEYKGVIGMDDLVLVNDNALLYITRLYFKDDNFLYADAETFDPDLFAGKRKENIINLQGMLLSGVRMPISVVIQALWSKRGVAEKIIKIKGFDFTQNNSFKGAGMEGDFKVFSETVADDSIQLTDGEQKEFSDKLDSGEWLLQTRVYSSEGSFIIADDNSEVQSEDLLDRIFSESETTTYKDVVSKYGLNSEEAKMTRSFGTIKITRESITNQNKSIKSNDLDKYLEIIKASGEIKDLQLISRSTRAKLKSILESVPEYEPNRDEMINYRLKEFLRGHSESLEDIHNKEYSNPSSVNDRLRDSNLPLISRLDRLVKQYKLTLNGKKYSEDELLKMKLLFIQDFNLIIKDCLGLVFKGRTFSSLLALNRFDKEIAKDGNELSTTYRKLMLSEKLMKFIPKGLYGEWTMDIQSLYNKVIKYVFGSELTQLQLNLIDYK